MIRELAERIKKIVEEVRPGYGTGDWDFSDFSTKELKAFLRIASANPAKFKKDFGNLTDEEMEIAVFEIERELENREKVSVEEDLEKEVKGTELDKTTYQKILKLKELNDYLLEANRLAQEFLDKKAEELGLSSIGKEYEKLKDEMKVQLAKEKIKSIELRDALIKLTEVEYVPKATDVLKAVIDEIDAKTKKLLEEKITLLTKVGYKLEIKTEGVLDWLFNLLKKGWEKIKSTFTDWASSVDKLTKLLKPISEKKVNETYYKVRDTVEIYDDPSEPYLVLDYDEKKNSYKLLKMSGSRNKIIWVDASDIKSKFEEK